MEIFQVPVNTALSTLQCFQEIGPSCSASFFSLPYWSVWSRSMLFGLLFKNILKIDYSFKI